MNATRRLLATSTVRAAWALLAALILSIGACEQNTKSPFLAPTGEVVDGGTEVYTSAFDQIQLLGELNGWDESTPSMDLVGNGVWGETVLVQAGAYMMKLRTDGAWDQPPDFGCCDETCNDQVPIPDDGTSVQILVCERSGFGGDIGPVQFPVTGKYEFTMDENAATFTIRSVGAPVPVGGITGTVVFADNPTTLPLVHISVRLSGVEVANAVTSTVDGTWSVDGLASGTYDLLFAAVGYTVSQTSNVVVNAPATTTAPTVTMNPQPIGSLGGVVSFNDNPSPRPVATVRVYTAGTNTQVGAGASSATTGQYAVANLLAGTYDVRFTAADYREHVETDVVILAQQVTTADVTMELDCATKVQIVGDFNSWDSAAPAMSITGPCTFADTLAIPAGCTRLKLRTDDDWDETPDFGRCSGAVGTCQVSAFPVQILTVCEGVGLSDAIGEVDFASGGTYYFEFDEGIGQLFIAYMGP